jgi:hypothetical protein
MSARIVYRIADPSSGFSKVSVPSAEGVRHTPNGIGGGGGSIATASSHGITSTDAPRTE